MTSFRSADILLEKAIRAVGESYLNEQDPAKSLAAFHCIQELKRQRSPAQLRRMDKRRGK